MKRLYDNLLIECLKLDDQMLFFAGPRQVGKTTTAKTAEDLVSNFCYLNWDNQDDRAAILDGPAAVVNYAKLRAIEYDSSILVFDEIHKYTHWKTFLKGFFDTYQDLARIVVTGSSRLDTFKKGGDSLMGRYFSYRMHPLSIRECVSAELSEKEIQSPVSIADADFNALFEFGGFPKPYLKREIKFSNRWNHLRKQQLFREDIRDLTRVHDLHRIEILAELLRQQAGSLVTYSSLANKLRVSVDTVSRWIKILESLYYCYSIRPWTKNITRSLIKEPKIYLWDWALVDDAGAKIENFVASHLLKAVHYWTDRGFGEYQLHYIRDLEKREVDFIVTKNNAPFFLVEVKKSDEEISKNLKKFAEQTKVPHVFQAVFDKPFVE